MVKSVLRSASSDTAPRDLPVVPIGYQAQLRLLTRGAERPGTEELTRNTRASSARLRVAERIEEAA